MAKELLRTITVTVPLVLPDYQPMLLSQRNSKTHSFLNKLRYSPETELINNFDKKSQFRFDCKNTTFCEHHKYKQRCYGFMSTPCRSSFKIGTFSINATKREQKIVYKHKTNENLIEQQIKFSNVQNHKKSYSTTTCRIILPFSPTEINRTPRSLL